MQIVRQILSHVKQFCIHFGPMTKRLHRCLGILSSADNHHSILSQINYSLRNCKRRVIALRELESCAVHQMTATAISEMTGFHLGHCYCSWTNSNCGHWPRDHTRDDLHAAMMHATQTHPCIYMDMLMYKHAHAIIVKRKACPLIRRYWPVQPSTFISHVIATAFVISPLPSDFLCIPAPAAEALALNMTEVFLPRDSVDFAACWAAGDPAVAMGRN